jgi:hypothetical protein
MIEVRHDVIAVPLSRRGQIATCVSLPLSSPCGKMFHTLR